MITTRDKEMFSVSGFHLSASTLGGFTHTNTRRPAVHTRPSSYREKKKKKVGHQKSRRLRAIFFFFKIYFSLYNEERNLGNKNIREGL